MSKWKNVRDAFLKNMRKRTISGQGAEHRRQYVYARQLSFLLGTTPAETESSIPHEDSTEVVEEASETGPPVEKRRTSNPTRQNIEESLIRFMNTPAIVQNPNMAFFESLRPALDDFTVDQQLQFQTEVLNIVKTIREQTPRSLIHQLTPSPTSPRFSLPQYAFFLSQPGAILFLCPHLLFTCYSSSEYLPPIISSPKL